MSFDAAKLGQYLSFTGGFNNLRTGGVQGVPGGEQGGGGKTGGAAGVEHTGGVDSYGRPTFNDAVLARIGAINGELAPKVPPTGNGQHLFIYA